jgi:hypothetical protein
MPEATNEYLMMGTSATFIGRVSFGEGAVGGELLTVIPVVTVLTVSAVMAVLTVRFVSDVAAFTPVI